MLRDHKALISCMEALINHHSKAYQARGSSCPINTARKSKTHAVAAMPIKLAGPC